MTESTTHITLHAGTYDSAVKPLLSDSVIATVHDGHIVQHVSGPGAQLVDLLLSLAGQAARQVDWDGVDASLMANVQRNAAVLAARVTVPAGDEAALSGVQGDHVSTGVVDDG